MGWGDYGAIGGGKTEANGTFHRGKNIIGQVRANMLVYEMSENGLALEAMGWSGDSGGPALIDVSGTYKVAGVNSNGDCCSYGDNDEYTRLGSSVAYAWIQANTANSAVGGGVGIDDCEVWWEGAIYLM